MNNRISWGWLFIIALLLCITFQWYVEYTSPQNPTTEQPSATVGQFTVGQFTVLQYTDNWINYEYVTQYEIVEAGGGTKVVFTDKDGMEGKFIGGEVRIEQGYVPMADLPNYGYFITDLEGELFND